MMPRWSERQVALLDALGLKLWLPAQQEVARIVADPQVAEGAVPRAEGATRDATRGSEDLAVAAHAVPLQSATIASMGWAELRAAVAGCSACPLCAKRTNTVFGIGHPRARWMIVGEAPGEQEDLRGEPFVGKSGQLLDSMLAALGLTRADGAGSQRQVYIANTLKCRPPGNRNPESSELARCEPFLMRQIELVGPSVIVAMGRFAVQSLLRSSEPIGRLRGRVHRCRDVPLVVTYHPAYLLRNLADKARAWEDLCLAREVARKAATAR